MIKYIATSKDGKRKLLGLVITADNIRLLKEERPIHFSAEDMGLHEIKVNDIAISYSVTEEEFQKMAQREGLIGEDTVVHKVQERKQ